MPIVLWPCMRKGTVHCSAEGNAGSVYRWGPNFELLTESDPLGVQGWGRVDPLWVWFTFHFPTNRCGAHDPLGAQGWGPPVVKWKVLPWAVAQNPPVGPEWFTSIIYSNNSLALILVAQRTLISLSGNLHSTDAALHNCIPATRTTKTKWTYCIILSSASYPQA